MSLQRPSFGPCHVSATRAPKDANECERQAVFDNTMAELLRSMPSDGSLQAGDDIADEYDDTAA